jgi:MinD superfamily P-loop ATPase
MSFKIAIASGKGGTGKTTVAVNLTYMISQFITPKVMLVDCDVEEPNDLLFFDSAKLVQSEDVEQMVPKIDTTACTFCMRCRDYCEFNAITLVQQKQIAHIDSDLCHSCGACLVACKYGAITEFPVKTGSVQQYKTGIGNGLTEGRLTIGSPMQTQVIRTVKQKISETNKVVIYDAPPGTSCPVVETLSDADYVILVTEPTPFVLYDLKLTLQLVKELGKPVGVVINKSGLGNDETYKYLRRENIDIIGEIPFSKSYAAKYAIGAILGSIPTEFATAYEEIVMTLKKQMEVLT